MMSIILNLDMQLNNRVDTHVCLRSSLSQCIPVKTMLIVPLPQIVFCFPIFSFLASPTSNRATLALLCQLYV